MEVTSSAPSMPGVRDHESTQSATKFRCDPRPIPAIALCVVRPPIKGGEDKGILDVPFK
jgi:hypothetical protein